ncbi:MAG: histidine--tRNA ligase [Longimicrobiaceae bacterium]
MPNHNALPGFRDFYPEDFAVRDHIVRMWREVARRYGFREYDGPPLEELDLYVEKSGPEIVQQLYSFTDKGEREVALRPEMTPTLARMVAARANGLRKPIKWVSVPQLFRYERQQRGRLREHFQLNVDIVGEAGVGADAELLACAIDVLRAFGLTERDVVARVSDRKLLRALLLNLGVDEEALTLVYNIVDKLERQPEEAIAARLTGEAYLETETTQRVLELFRRRDWESVSSEYGSRPGVAEEVARLRDYFALLEAIGVRDFVRFDLSVVRGLAYYTGIVWELWDARGELRAIAGGGRYDDLLRRVGGADLPALGFGMGDVVLGELLADRGLLPEGSAGIDYYLVIVTDDERAAALGLAHRLREAGASVEYGFVRQGVGKQFRNADALGARRAIVLGPDELSAGVGVVRDMRTGDEERTPLDEIGS